MEKKFTLLKVEHKELQTRLTYLLLKAEQLQKKLLEFDHELPLEQELEEMMLEVSKSRNTMNDILRVDELTNDN